MSLRAAIAIAAGLSFVGVAFAAEDERASQFEKHVRPLLLERCAECHSDGAAESELAVDSLAGLMKGGTRGPAIVPGQPEASLLMHAVRHSEATLQMPPKTKLATEEIERLARWIADGAYWPGEEASAAGGPAAADTASAISEEARNFWAFRPPIAPAPPEVADVAWVQSPIDRFVLAKLEQAGLRPAPPADRRTLLRRATFELTGLPPTPEEVEAFLADDSPDAFERAVDRLLASPAYGERWGRHWLDVARYADTNGLDENIVYGNAWRYRDYVIRSFDDDTPFDQFLREQIAGDLIFDPTDDGADAFDPVIATGFLSIGSKMLAEDDPVKLQMDIVDEQIDTVGRAFLGLTLGCARCHDHKFDPISAADYYALAGIFKSAQTMDKLTVVAEWHERELASPEQISARDAANANLAQVREKIAALEKSTEGTEESRAAELATLRTEERKLAAEIPVIASAMSVVDAAPADAAIHYRGSHLTLGPVVPRGFPVVLRSETSPKIESGSGRRELADWLASPTNPLTARVIANRLWTWHFGEGIVRSPDNFGKLGDRPTHPELLDWLATELVADGWRLKNLHRKILLSSTWQMSVLGDPHAEVADPENLLFHRRERRRLDIEAMRDGMLAISGELDRTIGGKTLNAENRKYLDGSPAFRAGLYDTRRRSVYLAIVRSGLYDAFSAFDFADPSALTGKRDTTVVAPQALFAMNSDFVAKRSESLAGMLLEKFSDDAARVDRLYRLVYGRPAEPQQTERALAYLDQYQVRWREAKPEEADQAERRAWKSLCRATLAANEYVYLD
ncbi:MAG TPA: PSD1 and planctomycete cytochrome C domain-containing protein [Pirellulaceae bacterium]|jgi:cytochrome c553|nr:PSD1 and planctomycete cytochrome C domain-containing protein [Pirellulaceae bacterium]